jgi:hypothetical protein
MRIPVKLPMMVRTDNIGVMFMAENASSGIRNRHIDTRYYFIREHDEDGFMKIVFVKKEAKTSELFTKNVNKDIYERHVIKFLSKIGGCKYLMGRMLECNSYIQILW